MSYSGKRYTLVSLPHQSLSISQCGMTICDSGHATPLRPYGQYAAHFILSGKGSYSTGGKTYELHAGQGFMIMPGIPNAYAADADDPWRYIYVCFSGPDDEALVHYAGLNEDNVTFSFDMSEDFLHDLYAMHKSSESPDAKGYDVTGYFLLVMSRLIRAHTQKTNDAFLPEHYVSRAISYMEDNYSGELTIADVAAHIGLDRTYLHRIFKKNTGLSPSQYLIACRLSKAEIMMAYEALSIGDIAQSVGFYDSSHFSKAFTQKYGLPPGKYRKEKYHL